MVAVNQESVLGSIIPDIYIKRIVLESGGTIPTESNPHIDHEREPETVRDPVTGKLIRQTVTPQDFKFKTKEESDPLTINVDLVIKEKLDNGMVASWFGNQDFMKYIRIKIIQSRDEEFTNRFATKGLELTVWDFIRAWFEFLTGATQTIKIKQFHAKSVLTKSSLDQHTTEVDDDGNTIHNIAFRVQFEIPESDPQHLAYFALSYLDVEQLAQDFNLDLPPGMEKELDGRIASEAVIEDHEVVSETFIFLDEQGAVWSGPVHQDDDERWKSGAKESEQSVFLELSTIPNSKIQDFRDVKEIERLQLDFTIIENEILGQTGNLRRLTNDNMDINRKRTYFTDAFISRDSQGLTRFLFGIDYLKMARENTVFGKLYRDDNEELLENIKIRSMKIKRIRSSNNKNALKDENGVIWFDREEEPPESIVISGETEPGEFKNVNTRKGALREIDLVLEENNPGIRFFTGIDKTMDKVTFGFYQYGVTVDIEDKTATFLSNVVNDLIEAYQVLKEYYNEGSSLEYFDVESNSFNQKFEKQKENDIDLEKETIMEENPRMSEEDAEELAIERMPWNVAVSTYLSAMSILNKKFDSERYSTSLLSFIHPLTGNPNGTRTVLKLIENLTVKLSNVIGVQITGKVSKWLPGQKQTRPQSVLHRNSGVPLRTFTIEKYFADRFDADMPRDVGYDFLSSGKMEREDNDDGLKAVSITKYERRVNKEVLKYYKTLDPDVNLKSEVTTYTTDDKLQRTKYSFLTPSSVRMGRNMQFLDQGASLFDSAKYLDRTARIAKFNLLSPNLFKNVMVTKKQPKEASRLSFSQQTLKDDLTPRLSAKNITIEPVRHFKWRELNTKSSSEMSRGKGPFVNTREIFGVGNNFLSEDYIVDEESSCGRVRDSEDITDVNPNSVIMDVLDNVIDQGDIAAPPVEPKLQEQKQAKFNTIQAFNIQKPQNLLDRMSNLVNPILITQKLRVSKPLAKLAESTVKTQEMTSKAQLSSQLTVRAIEAKPTTALKVSTVLETRPKETGEELTNVESVVPLAKQNAIKALPMQIKSVFVASVKPQVVVKNWFARGNPIDPLVDVRQRLNFKMNHNILRQIDVLVGFEVGTNEENTTQIKDAIWETMTSELFESAKNKNLLCRLKRYENKKLGIKCPKALDLPVYNEYFVLSPRKEIIFVPPRIREQRIPKKREIVRKQVIKNNKIKRQVQVSPVHTFSMITARIPEKVKKKQEMVRVVPKVNIRRKPVTIIKVQPSAIKRVVSAPISKTTVKLASIRTRKIKLSAGIGVKATKLFGLR